MIHRAQLFERYTLDMAFGKDFDDFAKKVNLSTIWAYNNANIVNIYVIWKLKKNYTCSLKLIGRVELHEKYDF